VSDHHYAVRVSTEAEEQVLKVKIRVSPEKDRYYLKLHYDQGYSQVWANRDEDEQKVKINHIFEPDLTDMNALRHKLKTYLVFS
jgi:hypothetical protein